jgi:hypothetical protein
MKEFWGTGYLLLPLLGGGVFHALCMKYDWFSFLVHPVDGGRTLWGKPLFGSNKTFRGLLTVGAGAAAVLALQAKVLHGIPAFKAAEFFDYASVNACLFGAFLGIAAMLSELPNSCVKRQLGIAPGQVARGVLRPIFFLWDQVDLMLGAWLVLALVVPVTFLRLAVSIAIVLVVHPLLALAGRGLRMRGNRK